MFLFVIPMDVDSQPLRTIVPVEVVVESPAKVEIGDSVTLTKGDDGFSVTVKSEPVLTSEWTGPTYNGEPCYDCQDSNDAVTIWTGDACAQTGRYEAESLGLEVNPAQCK